MDKLYYFNQNKLEFLETKKPIKWIRNLIVIIGVICVLWVLSLCLVIHTNEQLSKKNNELSEIINDMNESIEFIQTECNYENIIKVKIGEFAMHPHKQASVITPDSIASLLKALDAWYPDIKMAQIQCESRMGLGNISNNANNICGMRVTSQRETTQIKGKSYNGFGVYNNWESCVIDMVLWDYAVFKMKKPTREEYLKMLGSIYSESTSYVDAIKGTSQKYKQYFN